MTRDLGDIRNIGSQTCERPIHPKLTPNHLAMSYIKEESGLLNNFAKEPRMYVTDVSGETQPKSYLLPIGAAIVIIGGMIAVAALASA
jgi:hypothetical protein